MSKKMTIFLTVVITLVAIAVLAGGGYALYRWGYLRGLAADTGGLMGVHIIDQPTGALVQPEVRERLGERFPGALERFETSEPIMTLTHQANLSRFPGRFSFSPLSILVGGIHLLVGAGVLALAVYGGIQLVRSGKATTNKK
ncbi:MAG TPA: hypothetical protein G4O08_04935 [Anaerolineae bacterium]|nr:hypothetical protein [Anaerolineae bacterium]